MMEYQRYIYEPVCDFDQSTLYRKDRVIPYQEDKTPWRNMIQAASNNGYVDSLLILKHETRGQWVLNAKITGTDPIAYNGTPPENMFPPPMLQWGISGVDGQQGYLSAKSAVEGLSTIWQNHLTSAHERLEWETQNLQETHLRPLIPWVEREGRRLWSDWKSRQVQKEPVWKNDPHKIWSLDSLQNKVW